MTPNELRAVQEIAERDCPQSRGVGDWVVWCNHLILRALLRHAEDQARAGGEALHLSATMRGGSYRDQATRVRLPAEGGAETGQEQPRLALASTKELLTELNARFDALLARGRDAGLKNILQARLIDLWKEAFKTEEELAQELICWRTKIQMVQDVLSDIDRRDEKMKLSK